MPPEPQPDWLIVDRAEFLHRRFAYEPGQHLTAIGQTRWGKTTLLQQLIDAVATPKLPATMMVMKPRDKTVRDFLREHDGFKLIKNWPPPPRVDPFSEKPRGYVLWPVQKPRDIHTDADQMYSGFHAYLSDSYRRGNRIVFADELFGLDHDLGLGDEINALYMRGGAMGAGVWSAVQAPVGVSRHAYSQSEHIFISRDPDADRRKRASEIGGVDPKEILHNLNRIEKYQWLYVRRSDSARCIVGK